MKITINDQELYIDENHKHNLDKAKQVLKEDWDMIFCYDGYEGSGKSTKAIQDAFYCDPTLTLERITFTPDDFKKQIIKAQQYQAVVYDEAYTGLSSRSAMSRVNKTLVQMLAEIRQKNLFVFVVMPTFFDLDKYVALWRTRALVHVYSPGNFERGYFAFYNIDKKKDLYINGKKYYSYSKPKPNFIGRFTKYFPLDKTEYRRKKKQSLTDREEQNIEDDRLEELKELMFNRLQELDEPLTHRIKIKILRIPESTYYTKLKKYEEYKEFSS